MQPESRACARVLHPCDLSRFPPMADNHHPLVSIICFCRNRASMIRRCIESVIGQSYSNIEFVVQDGASVDGTFEILREYADRDDRIKLISAPDSGPAEAFWKVLHRCRGEIIGTCLSDEELLPSVVASAVERFLCEPRLGALTCDGLISDESGRITGEFKAGEFDFVAYLFGRYCPFWPGSFFRRKALIDVGLLDDDWNLDCIEFEIWCRLATDHEVKYWPQPVSKYAVHPSQASNTPANFNEHVDGRLKLIEKMFSPQGFFGPDEFLKLECMINQVHLFHNHARAYQLTEEERSFATKITELEERQSRLGKLWHPYRMGLSAAVTAKIEGDVRRIVRLLQRVVPKALMAAIPTRVKLRFVDMIEFATTVHATGRLPERVMQGTEAKTYNYWARTAVAIPAGLRRLLPRRVKDGVRIAMLRAYLLLLYVPVIPFWCVWWVKQAWPMRTKEAEIETAAPDASRLLFVYPRVAQLYDGRGQTRQALEMWRHAEALNDPTIDSLACQAILKLPEASYVDIAELQKRWADKHATPISSRTNYRFSPYDDRRKLRIGYHCSFMESDTIRYIMRNVIAAHDRSRFKIYGYAPGTMSSDIKSAFDVVRDTQSLDPVNFIDAVRGDQIDVFIELTGLSPGHRYLEMETRCAPVQVSYLNHHGTSCISAVDYFLSDEISTPEGSLADATFTEQIYRLPGCLLCYDYDGYSHPPVADPPSRAKGSVTFGCFGSGSKINSKLIEWWAALLKSVPRSTLYLRNPQLSDLDNQRYISSRFRWFGIGPERLRLARGTDRTSLLKCYDEVDISLDTWPYCGGNTVAESLWQGVPVVTLRGERISSRYGASLLTAAGCESLIADNSEGYIKLAAELTENPDKLQFLRSNLRTMCKDHGLGNSARFARNLEIFYQWSVKGERPNA